MFKNLTVAKRLALAFGLVSILISAFAAVMGIQLNGIKAGVHQIADDRYPKIDLSRDIHDNINAQARILGLAIIATSNRNVAEAQDFLSRLEPISGEINVKLDKLKAMVNAPKGEAMFKAMIEARTAYLDARSSAVRLLQEGKWQEAGKLTLGEIRVKQDLYFDRIKEMVDFQQGQMEEASKAAKDQIVWSTAATLIVAVMVLALSLVAAYAITRSLLSQLGGEPAAARDAARRIAQGDLTGEIPVKPGDTQSLFAALQGMHRSLVGMVSHVRQGSESVATASTQISQGNEDLSQRTEQQARALQQTAATMGQRSAAVQRNADSAKQANQLAQGAHTVAVQGGEVMGQVAQTMERIHHSGGRIIDGIAFQTNILALTAAIEAAQAGEQGRGFVY